MYFLSLFLLINSAYKSNVEKLKDFWPDSSAKFTNSFVSVTTWTPFPISLFSLSLSSLSHTHTHTRHAEATTLLQVKACNHTHKHTHTQHCLCTSLKWHAVWVRFWSLCVSRRFKWLSQSLESESQSCWVCLKCWCYVNLAFVQWDVAWVELQIT